MNHSISSEREIIRLVEADTSMMQVLQAAESLALPDWWIGAGFLRNRIWDEMEGNAPLPPRDVDLVYFDPNVTDSETDWRYDQQMAKELPGIEWEIRNQARMHYKNGLEPFSSTADGISHWVETATCVGVKLEKGILKLLFCYGTDDLLGLIARPTPLFAKPDRIHRFHERIIEKKWRERWPHLRVETE